MEIKIGLAQAKSGKMDMGKDAGAVKAGNIIAKMFADRTFAHMAHLKTSSHAAHKALNKFYDDVVDVADDFAEAAQGKFGKLNIPVGQVSTDLSNAADVLEMSCMDIRKESEGCNNKALLAIVDDIEALYLSTIYKLRELH